MFDTYSDVTERLDRALLTRPEPPCHALAREQLGHAGIKAKKIIAARPEAILFVNEFGKVITAWSEVRAGGAVVFYCEAGMPAWPSAVPEAA